MRSIGACTLGIAVVLGCCAPALAATPFGTNLNRPADNTVTCSQINFLLPSTTCSAESVNLLTGESPIPPVGDGVVTRVRVRVGPVTGPMQVVVEEALRQDNPGDPGHPIYACCKAIDASRVFTPAPNAVTAVNVNLPVKQSATPEESGYYVDDHLSLSVLNPNVPIPASTDPNASVEVWFPAWRVGDERAGFSGTSGADVLLNADWDPIGAGAGAAAAVLRLADNVARVRSGRARISLLCQLATACEGTLALQNQQVARQRPLLRAAKRPKTYAQTKFSIAASATETVKAKLNRAGKKLLKRHQRVKVWMNITLDGSSATVPPLKLKLKR